MCDFIIKTKDDIITKVYKEDEKKYQIIIPILIISEAYMLSFKFKFSN